MKPSWTVIRLTEAVGQAADRGVQVGRAGEPVGELADADRVAAPEVAHGVPVLAVPLPPQRREPAQVVAVHLADVPRLGDQLGLAHHRVLGAHVQEGRHLVEGAVLAGQRGRQVEPEPVGVHLGQPVAQRVHHQLQHDRVAGVQRVAAAGRVVVEAGVAGLDPVVGQVVDAAEAQRRAVRPGFGGVVEHHVEDHFQAGLVQRVDHRLELGDLPARAAGPDGGGVAVVRGEEADRVVAPVVRQALRDQERLGHVLVHRQQFDGGDAQVAQVRDGGLVAQAGVGPAQLRRDVRVAHGEALDVDLVEDRVRVAVPGPLIVVPAECRVHDQAPGHVPGGVQGGSACRGRPRPGRAPPARTRPFR